MTGRATSNRVRKLLDPTWPVPLGRFTPFETGFLNGFIKAYAIGFPLLAVFIWLVKS